MGAWLGVFDLLLKYTESIKFSDFNNFRCLKTHLG